MSGREPPQRFCQRCAINKQQVLATTVVMKQQQDTDRMWPISLCDRCAFEDKVGRFDIPAYLEDECDDRLLVVDEHGALTVGYRQHERLEPLGYSNEIGEDGYPIDPRHPFNRRTSNG
jgi:hypothetical protein